MEQGQPRTAAAEKIKAGLKESPKATRASQRAAGPWQALPLQALLDEGSLEGYGNIFCAAPARSVMEIEITAEGEIAADSKPGDRGERDAENYLDQAGRGIVIKYWI